jgi:hypothetical protein
MLLLLRCLHELILEISKKKKKEKKKEKKLHLLHSRKKNKSTNLKMKVGNRNKEIL